jgi:hypothetical protein
MDGVYLEMEKVYFDEIIKQDGITHGLVVFHKTVVDNLKIIFGEELAIKVLDALTIPPDGGHFIERFCQFIILVNYSPTIGFSMKISDYKGNLDVALDEYSELQKNNWDQADIDKIMLLFQEIENKPTELAEMVLQGQVL